MNYEHGQYIFRISHKHQHIMIPFMLNQAVGSIRQWQTLNHFFYTPSTWVFTFMSDDTPWSDHSL